MGPTYIAWSPSASSTVLYLSNTVRSPPTHSARVARPGKQVQAARGELLVQSPDQRRRVRREIEPHRARAHAPEQPVVAEGDRLDLTRARQRGKDHLGRLGDCTWTVCPLRARGEMRRGRLATDVVDGEVVTGRAHVERHGAAHDSESDEPDSHVGLLPLTE